MKEGRGTEKDGLKWIFRKADNILSGEPFKDCQKKKRENRRACKDKGDTLVSRVKEARNTDSLETKSMKRFRGTLFAGSEKAI